MSERERLMEAELGSALASLDEAFEIGIEDDEVGLAIGDAHARLSKALAEARALPASNTEAMWLPEGMQLIDRELLERVLAEKASAKERLAQIAELLVKAGDSCARAQWCGKNIDDALRLARGEEAS